MDARTQCGELPCSTLRESWVKSKEANMYIYVAASWRTPRQQEVVQALQNAGYLVYDFKNPPESTGFHWSSIDPSWKEWPPAEYRDALQHPLAKAGFASDYLAMQKAEVFVGVQPFGRSASMEMGWAAGNGKHTILLLDKGEPELMVKMFSHLCLSLPEVLTALQGISLQMERERRHPQTL